MRDGVVVTGKELHIKNILCDKLKLVDVTGWLNTHLREYIVKENQLSYSTSTWSET